MQPHFKIVIVAENASELLSKSRELARELTAGASLIEEVGGAQRVAAGGFETDRIANGARLNQDPIPAHVPQDVPSFPPVASAGQQTVPVATGSASASERDAVGMPFDARIHMNKKKADGTWQNKRGLDAGLKAQVEAELRGGSLPAGNQIPQAAAVPQNNVVPFAPPAMPAAPQAPAPLAPQMGIAHGHTADTFGKNLPLILMELTNAGKLKEDYVGQLKNWLGLTELVDVVRDPAKTQQLFDLFVKYSFIQAAQ